MLALGIWFLQDPIWWWLAIAWWKVPFLKFITILICLTFSITYTITWEILVLIKQLGGLVDLDYWLCWWFNFSVVTRASLILSITIFKDTWSWYRNWVTSNIWFVTFKTLNLLYLRWKCLVMSRIVIKARLVWRDIRWYHLVGWGVIFISDRTICASHSFYLIRRLEVFSSLIWHILRRGIVLDTVLYDVDFILHLAFILIIFESDIR